MMNSDLVKQLFAYLKANPDVSFDDFVALLVSQSNHTTETASQWIQAFIEAMYVPRIIEDNTFDEMKSKVDVLDDMSVEEIINLTLDYVIKNPLRYQLEKEKEDLLQEKAYFETLPDVIENFEKIGGLSRVNDRIQEIDNLI